MKRTVLYYPTISIPNNWWLRQALFYFDEVASIVPQTMTWGGESKDILIPLTEDIESLKAEGIFRAISTEQLTMGRTWEEASKLEEELKEIVSSERHRAQRSDEYVHVHRGKTNEIILGIFNSENLVKPAASAPHGGDPSLWMMVEKNTAFIYLSLMAKYLAALDEEPTVPGTDRREYRDLIYGASDTNEAEPGIQLHLQRVLPVPKPGTDIKKIVAFKRKRRDELLQFRSGIDGLEKELANCQEKEDVRRTLLRFSETQEREASNFAAALADAKLETVLGSVKTLVKSNSPTFWGSLMLGVGGVALASEPISLAGLVVGGVTAICEVSTYLLDRRSKARATRQSAVAYLHYAKAEGLI